MRDWAIFGGDTRDGGSKQKRAGCGNFNNQRERDFLFLWGWDARIRNGKIVGYGNLVLS